jgi:dTDP-4-dehydrorhamnose reductase
MAERPPAEILLTGGAGQLGTELQRLAPSSWRIAAPPRRELDISRPDQIAAAMTSRRWSLVINAAAHTAVDRAEDDVAAAWAANAMGPAVLAAESARAGAPIIHVSTDYVFDGTKSSPYVEADPVAPLGVYGASKEGGEQAVRTANSRHVILRTAWVVSPHGANFIKTMFHLAGQSDERPALRVVDDQLGCPTSAADLARAVIAVGERLIADPTAPAGLYHFVNSGEASWCELAREAFRLRSAHGLPAPSLEAITTAQYPTRVRRPANSRLSTAKLERDYGVVARPWRVAIKEVVDALVAAAEKAA